MIFHKETQNHMPKIYSYIRFSTLKQAMGDSERRQLEAAKKYAQEKGLPLDETLIDRGVSGFNGEHRKKGALGRFLVRVKNKEVPLNSILLIENIDRLGREPIIEAFETVTELIKNGVKIQTLMPPELYDTKSINTHVIYQLIGQIQRAHEESKRKSDLISQARERARIDARKTGKILTSRCPAWLDIERDCNRKPTKFKVKNDAKAAIQKIFDFKLAGIGTKGIEKKLNTDSFWMPPKGNGWHASYIEKILHNPSVIGEYQPFSTSTKIGKREPIGEPIPDYYPKIIKSETFFAVQEIFKNNKKTGGKTGKAYNIFKNFIKCPYCGGSMVFQDKGKSPKGGRYLVCDNGRRQFKCSHKHRIKYDECQTLILQNCKDLKPEQVLPNPTEQIKFRQSLEIKIRGLIANLDENNNKIENLVNAISEDDSQEVKSLLKKKIDGLNGKKPEIAEEIAKTKRELKKTENSLKSFSEWQKGLIDIINEIDKNTLDAAELRIRLRCHLRKFIEKIEVFSVGFKELYDTKEKLNISLREIDEGGEIDFMRNPCKFDNTETAAHLLYENAYEVSSDICHEQSFEELVKYFLSRRMSKEGRFLRVNFKSGYWVDLVPEGSLAWGYKLDKKNEWISIKHDFSKIYYDWEKIQRKKLGNGYG